MSHRITPAARDETSPDKAGSNRAKNLLLAVVAALTLAGLAYSCGHAQNGGAPPEVEPPTGVGRSSVDTADGQQIRIIQTSPLAELTPGQPAQELSGTFTNPNHHAVYVTSVTAVVAGTTRPGCSAHDYTIDGSPTRVAARVPPGTRQGAWSGITIRFNNQATNQDACKNARIQLSYTSN